MTMPQLLLFAAMGAPALQVLLLLAPWRGTARDVANLGCALISAVAAAGLVMLGGDEPERFVLARPAPGLEIALGVDPLGAGFAASAAGLGALAAAYAASFMSLTNAPDRGRFQALAALAMLATLGCAYADNLFTLFVFYEALTLATFPLMARGDEQSGRSAALYLMLMLALAMGALLPAIIWAGAVAGDLSFVPGGIFEGRLDPMTANLLLALFVLGIGKAGIIPFHRWITAQGEAPAHAAALTLGVTATAVGGFALIRIVAFIFGAALEEAEITTRVVAGLGVATVIAGSLGALAQRAMIERITSVAIAQQGALAAAAMLAPLEGGRSSGWFSASLHLAASSCALTTLFFAAGAMQAASGLKNVDELPGLGRKMPWTFGAFAIAALSVAGAPPTVGAWAKLWLIVAATQHGELWIGAGVGLGMLAVFVALGAPAMRALFAPSPTVPLARPDGAPLLMVAPTALAGVATLLLLAGLGGISTYLGALGGGP